ncbi:nucleotidyltransferase family protein [Treponema medium]|uniref:nucleotidyltransferase family protein n=1 Tax=Treponema medium TaxID=58231 RepID=UPI0020913727|nr:nucleotidyltransferase family protein [Treponema medium]
MNTISTAPAKNNNSSREQPLTAILLAGGLSTRMGCCKQLRPLCGKPLIQYGIEMLFEAGITHLVITVNSETQQPITEMVERLTQKQPVQSSALKEPTAGSRTFHPFRCDIVFNPEPERGQGHSAALAVQAACVCHTETLAVQTVRRSCTDCPASNTVHTYIPSGFLFCTADQPFLQANSIRNICAVFRLNPGRIVSAAFNGKHCSPVIFPAALADELSRLDGSIGGRTVMNAHPDLILHSPLHSEMEAFDIDTPEDFTHAEEYMQRQMQSNRT